MDHALGSALLVPACYSDVLSSMEVIKFDAEAGCSKKKTKTNKIKLLKPYFSQSIAETVACNS